MSGCVSCSSRRLVGGGTCIEEAILRTFRWICILHFRSVDRETEKSHREEDRCVITLSFMKDRVVVFSYE